MLVKADRKHCTMISGRCFFIVFSSLFQFSLFKCKQKCMHRKYSMSHCFASHKTSFPISSFGDSGVVGCLSWILRHLAVISGIQDVNKKHEHTTNVLSSNDSDKPLSITAPTFVATNSVLVVPSVKRESLINTVEVVRNKLLPSLLSSNLIERTFLTRNFADSFAIAFGSDPYHVLQIELTDKKMLFKVSNFHSYFASPPSDNKQDKQNKSLQSVYLHAVFKKMEDFCKHGIAGS